MHSSGCLVSNDSNRSNSRYLRDSGGVQTPSRGFTKVVLTAYLQTSKDKVETCVGDLRGAGCRSRLPRWVISTSGQRNLVWWPGYIGIELGPHCGYVLGHQSNIDQQRVELYGYTHRWSELEQISHSPTLLYRTICPRSCHIQEKHRREVGRLADT